jgi:3-phosphoshikimate 1-carboxyvinyltransferase
MSACLKDLGVLVEDLNETTSIVYGSGGALAAPHKDLFAGNSGTTIRFLTAIAALTPIGSKVTFDGTPRMRQRPIIDLVEALEQIGVTVAMSANGCPPVTVMGGGIGGGQCSIKGTTSSQYLSALLMAAPHAAKNTEINILGDLVSRPYIDITLRMMEDFGVTAVNHNFKALSVPSSSAYHARDYAIEPDASNASYFIAAAAVTGGTVTVNNLGTSSIQGDFAVVDVFEQMGCKITRSSNSVTIDGPSVLTGIEFDAVEIPDMAQTLAVVACFAAGSTRLSGLSNLRVKETDRIAAMATELRKIGADVDEGSDYLVIHPKSNYIAAAIDTYDDHRMAMSFAVAGLRIDGLTINDPGCVSKTFPDFWKRWESAFSNSAAYEGIL